MLIYPVTHTLTQQWLQTTTQGAGQPPGAIWGSVSCPSALWHGQEEVGTEPQALWSVDDLLYIHRGGWGSNESLILTVAHCKTVTSNSCVYSAGHLQQEGVMVERKKRSKAQLHFMKKDDNNSAGCNVCKMIISSKSGVRFSCFSFQTVVGKHRGDVRLPQGPKSITLFWSQPLHPAVEKRRNGKLLLVLCSCCIYLWTNCNVPPLYIY